MKHWDMEKVNAIQRMQDYIRDHVESEAFSFEEMYSCGGYSKRHGDRIFKEFIGKTPKEYVRAIRLSESSLELLNSSQRILDIALNSSYQSHEGYVKAFWEAFHVTPSSYRNAPDPIPLFVQYPIQNYFTLINHKEDKNMCKEMKLCMITAVSRPKRKIILMRSATAVDYFSFCQEAGCDWEGLFNSIPEKYDMAAIVELPANLVKEGTSSVAAGVEVPYDYAGAIPKGCDAVELEPCEMLYFQSEPYEKEEDFCVAIDSVQYAIEKYNGKAFGYQLDDTLAPKFNYGANTVMGAKQAVPASRL